MKKAINASINIILIFAVVAGLYYAYEKSIEEEKQKAIVLPAKKEIDPAQARINDANEKLEEILNSPYTYSAYWHTVEEKQEEIEMLINSLIEEYPDLEAARKAEAFRYEYLPILEEVARKAEDEKAIREKGLAEKDERRKKDIADFYKVAGYNVPEDDKEYWYDYFSESERQKLVTNKVEVGDREAMILFLPGFYERKITESTSGTFIGYYGHRGAKYKYISADNGIIDYIEY